jgi:glutamate dehydrogenase/leucine dehydrogenase
LYFQQKDRIGIWNILDLTKEVEMAKLEMKIVEDVQADDIGPELIVHWYDPELQVRGVMIVDSLALGMATGGTRMLPDITTKEIFMLARAMTYKKAIMGVPVGGAKAGIWEDPNVKGPRREAIFRAFGRAMKPLYKANIVLYGSDMGVNDPDVKIFREEAGYQAPSQDSAFQQLRDGEPLENHFTGYGVVVSAKEACKFAGQNISGAKVAIEGFGKVGGGAARYLVKEGAKIVALSTIKGAIYNQNGLDMKELFELRKKFGDDCILKYKDAKEIGRGDLLFLPVDVLIPGGRPHVINEKNVDRVKTKVIASGANIPVTDGALQVLFNRGVMVVPDFVANSGGSTAGLSRRSGLNPDQTFIAIEKVIGGNTREILEEAAKKKVNPTQLASERVLQKVRQAKAGKLPRMPHDVALKEFRKMVGM